MLAEFTRAYDELYRHVVALDGIPEDEPWFLPALGALIQKYGSETAIAFAQTQAWPEFTFELLVKAGLRGIDKDLLLQYTNTLSEDGIYCAAFCLAACGYDEGFEILTTFANRTHPLSKDIGPPTDILPDVRFLEGENAKKLEHLCKTYKETLLIALKDGNEHRILKHLLKYFKDNKPLTSKEKEVLLDFEAHTYDLIGLIGLVMHDMPRIILGKLCSDTFIQEACCNVKHTLKDLEAIADTYMETEQSYAELYVYGEIMLKYPRDNVDDHGNLLK